MVNVGSKNSKFLAKVRKLEVKKRDTFQGSDTDGIWRTRGANDGAWGIQKVKK